MAEEAAEGDGRGEVVVDAHPTLKKVGMGLAIGGLSQMAAGVGIGFLVGYTNRTEEGYLGYPGYIVGGSIMGIGGLIAIVGVPLWIKGDWDITVPSDDPRAKEAAFSLRAVAGPGSFAFTGTF
ncbi:MAG: hypothetical protein R3B72_24730 [Polyangiaceae bacterium]